jgi:membrane protein implicated in regulation of membrane protease activity
MALFFGTLMGIGLLYLLLVIAGGLGDVFNLDGTLESMGLGGLFGIDDLSGIADAADAADAADVTSAGGEAEGIGCMVLSAFMAMFGAVGLVGTLTGRPLWITLIVGVVMSYAVARSVAELLKYVFRQQDNDAFSMNDLIGMTARSTIKADAGTTGEVMVELGRVLKFPVREVNGAALARGDQVVVVGVDGRFLEVEKITT